MFSTFGRSNSATLYLYIQPRNTAVRNRKNGPHCEGVDIGTGMNSSYFHIAVKDKTPDLFCDLERLHKVTRGVFREVFTRFQVEQIFGTVFTVTVIVLLLRA